MKLVFAHRAMYFTHYRTHKSQKMLNKLLKILNIYEIVKKEIETVFRREVSRVNSFVLLHR